MSNKNNTYLHVKRERQSIEQALEKAEKRQKKHHSNHNQVQSTYKQSNNPLNTPLNPQTQTDNSNPEVEEYIWNKSIDNQTEQIGSEIKYSLKININKEKEQKVKELLRNKTQMIQKSDKFTKLNKRDRMKKNAFNFAEKGSIEKSLITINKQELKKKSFKNNGSELLNDIHKYERIRPRYYRNIVKLSASDLIPDIEPWDIQYMPQGVKWFKIHQRNSLECATKDENEINNIKLDDFINEVNKYRAEIESKVNNLVYHPIPIKSEYLEKINKTVLPVFLTTKEKKRVRRLKKIEKLKDTQEKIKLGLLKPKPPKLKYSNFIQLFKDETVSDPSQLELKVKKAYEERYNKMQKENEMNKLTKEQRGEKLKRKFERDSKKECRGCVFRVDVLASNLNRCKIDKNSQQLYLTGICLMTRSKNAYPTIVYVEGGPLAIKKMKNLLLRRIKWKESEKEESAKCILAWEGNIKKRLFDKWKMIEIKTESDAIKILSEKNMENMWHLVTSCKN